MKHLFSTGEILYAKNKKKLDEGELTAEALNYADVIEGGTYEAVGKIQDQPVSVKFKIKKECYVDLNFKAMIKILMQSELLQADWEEYSINYQ